MPTKLSNRFLRQPLFFLITMLIIALLMAIGPVEKTLGANIRLVLLHGAWVWTGKVAFGLASLLSIAAIIRAKQPVWFNLSRASAYTGLFFWLTYLPMSLIVMQLNWGGLFFDEPRWRIPFLFGVVAVLLQVGLWLFSNRWITIAGNFIFGIALWWQLGSIQNILHPDMPVAQSNSSNIQLYFVLLVILALLFGIQIGFWIYKRLQRSPKLG
jgi:hypothetical protein